MKFIAPESPKIIAPPPPPSPTSADPAVAAATQKAMADAAARERAAKGRASTILTGAQGDTSQAPTARNILLGS